MNLYEKYLQRFSQQFHAYRKQYRIVGFFRLLLALASIYFFCLFLSRENHNYLYITLALMGVFIFLMRIHAKLSRDMRYRKALMDINQEEIDFLEKGALPFADGFEFNEAQHAYSFDLDIFGPHSLFQHINRTASHVGKSKLAARFNAQGTESEIVRHQEAIKELSILIEWRQEIQALNRISSVSAGDYQKIKAWSAATVVVLPRWIRVASRVLPLFFAAALVASFLSSDVLWSYLASLFFAVNLILTTSQMKRIQREIVGSDKIHETIDNYSLIIKRLERAQFKSELLNDLLKELRNDGVKAKVELKKLSNYFEKINTVANIVVLVVFNGIFQYHLHVLDGLLKWKQKHGQSVPLWIEVVGEIEALNSLANFAYNNREYSFPQINREGKMSFKDLGHPLIAVGQRVCNDIDLSEQRFVILTGSNMSGKSTFLRTVGINLVLAGMGAPICSSNASFFPMPIFVSMRLSDSLNDSESYFYAEVKRLKQIMDAVAAQPCFVLLDEILRGTNSDDKQTGTIGVILKLIKNPTCGLIATHDLEVCEITAQQPQILVNKCFEVEINGEDLHFDYKIRDGICKNKNATFIMKKMGIIG